MDKLVIDRLEAVLARYNQIQEDLQNDEVIANLKKYTELSKEARQLEPTFVAYSTYKNAHQTIEEAKILLLEEDAEMVEMAKEEIKAEVDAGVYEDEISMMEMVMDVDDIISEMSSIRDEFCKYL